MIIEITDPNGAPNLRIGMAKGDLHRTLGSAREFRRTPQADVSEQFVDAGVMATYDAEARVSILEFADPADPRLSGVSVLGLPVESLRNHLIDVMGLEAVSEEDTVAVPLWRMSFYVPDGIVEGMLLGE
jgi:hypothetical protein